MKNFCKAGATALALLGMAQAAIAATATGNLLVSATVTDTCVVTASPLAFASLNTSGGTDADASIALNCTADKTSLTVTLSGGANYDGSTRRMDDGGTNFVPYQIYADSARSNLVDSGESIYTGAVTGGVQKDIDVFGQVPAGSYVFGTYDDTVVITVNY